MDDFGWLGSLKVIGTSSSFRTAFTDLCPAGSSELLGFCFQFFIFCFSAVR